MAAAMRPRLRVRAMERPSSSFSALSCGEEGRQTLDFMKGMG